MEWGEDKDLPETQKHTHTDRQTHAECERLARDRQRRTRNGPPTPTSYDDEEGLTSILTSNCESLVRSKGTNAIHK